MFNPTLSIEFFLVEPFGKILSCPTIENLLRNTVNFFQKKKVKALHSGGEALKSFSLSAQKETLNGARFVLADEIQK